MIVKFFNRGTGGGNGPVDYLLGKDRKREGATLDQGDCDSVINLINSCDFKQKYKSGCLSFEERDLSKANKDKIMAEFEKVLLPGLDKNQYSILWVEHKDKDRLELNFVVPCVELTTGKRLQPYYHPIDCKRLDVWKRCINTMLHLHDPDAPENKRSAMDLNVTNLPFEKKKQISQISNALLNQIESGLVKKRSDVVRSLESAGFTITRKHKNTISIKDPNGGKNIKLKGVIYEEAFEFSGNYAERVAADQAIYTARKPQEFARNQADLARLCRAKSERNKQLYQVPATKSETARHQLQGIIQQARERSEEKHRLSNQLSRLQDAEIQRCNTLNHAGIHGGDERDIVENGGGYNSATSSNSRVGEQGRESSNNDLWGSESIVHQNRSGADDIRNGRGLPVDGTRGILNDRARETPTGSINRAIKKSRDHVSRFQEYFREFGQSLVRATEVLRGFTAGKQKSDSVSNEIDRASHRFSDTVKRFIREEERELKLDKKVENNPFRPTLR